MPHLQSLYKKHQINFSERYENYSIIHKCTHKVYFIVNQASEPDQLHQLLGDALSAESPAESTHAYHMITKLHIRAKRGLH